DGVHDRPELKAVAAVPGNLILEKRGEVIVVEQAFPADRRTLEGAKTARAEVAFAEPLFHRGAESLLAAIHQIVLDVSRRHLLDNPLADAVAQLVAAPQSARQGGGVAVAD